MANNGIEAVKAVQEIPYDLLLMEVSMPEMDGIEATIKIRGLSGDKGRIPIIALTANAMKGDRERFLAAGMNDYVSKPLDRKKLMTVVNAWAQRSNNADPAPGPEIEADEDGPPVLDSAVILEWENFFPAGQFAELISSQVDDAAPSLERLDALAASRDYDELGKLAHSLKGNYGNLGMYRVSKVTKELERACLEGREEEALDMVPTVSAEVTQAVDALRLRYSALLAGEYEAAE